MKRANVPASLLTLSCDALVEAGPINTSSKTHSSLYTSSKLATELISAISTFFNLGMLLLKRLRSTPA